MSMLQWVNIFLSMGLPLVVGYFTKKSLNPHVKAIILLGLAAVAAFGSGLVASQSFDDWKSLLVQSVVNWLIAVATYFHLWKPTGVAALLAKIGFRDTPRPLGKQP